MNELAFAKLYQDCLKIVNGMYDDEIEQRICERKRKRLCNTYCMAVKENDIRYQEFHSIVFELRFYEYMKNLGFNIKPHNDQTKGPDYVVTDLGYIECVSATLGKDENLLDKVTNMEKCRYSLYDEFLPRISASINDKQIKFKKYQEEGVVKPNEPLIIAVSTTIISDIVASKIVEPMVWQILYGIANEYLPLYNQSNAESFFGYKKNIIKPVINKDNEYKTIDVDYFHDKNYKNISAVILVNNSGFENITHDYFTVFLNSEAKNPINCDLLNEKKIRYLQEEQSNEYKFY